MKRNPLPEADHVLRHCRQRDLKTEADGTIRGIFPDALEPDDDGISVTWLEYFPGSPDQQLVAARQAMNRGRKLRVSNRLAKLKVSIVVTIGRAAKRDLAVIHDPIEQPPEKENLAHSLIVGINPDDADLRNRLAMAVSSSDLEHAVV